MKKVIDDIFFFVADVMASIINILYIALLIS